MINGKFGDKCTQTIKQSSIIEGKPQNVINIEYDGGQFMHFIVQLNPTTKRVVEIKYLDYDTSYNYPTIWRFSFIEEFTS